MAQYAHLSERDPEWAAIEPHVPKGMVITSIPEFRAKVTALRAQIDAAGEKGPTEGLRVIATNIPVEGGEVPVRVYIPDPQEGEADGFPLFLWMYGGGWILGNLDNEDALLRSTALNSRVTCICGDQRKAPEYPYPTPLDDSEAVLKWALHQSYELSINQSKGVIVAGMSSGGNIAAVLAQRGLKDPGLKGVITGQLLVEPCVVSPYAYPERFKHELLSVDKDEDGRFLTKQQLLTYTEAYHGKDNASNPEVSPALAESFENLPPAYIQIAGLDLLRDEGYLYERLLREAGVPTRLDVYPGIPHGFQISLTEFKATKKQKKDFAAGLDWLLHRTK